MADIIIFDPNQNPNPVVNYLFSQHTPDYQNRSDALINPKLDSVAGLPMKYWKHVSGSIVPMTLPEQNAVDSAIALKIDADSKVNAINLFNGLEGRLFRAVVLALLDEINTLRSSAVLPMTAISSDQIKTNIQNKTNSSVSD